MLNEDLRYLQAAPGDGQAAALAARVRDRPGVVPRHGAGQGAGAADALEQQADQVHGGGAGGRAVPDARALHAAGGQGRAGRRSRRAVNARAVGGLRAAALAHGAVAPQAERAGHRRPDRAIHPAARPPAVRRLRQPGRAGEGAVRADHQRRRRRGQDDAGRPTGGAVRQRGDVDPAHRRRPAPDRALLAAGRPRRPRPQRRL